MEVAGRIGWTARGLLYLLVALLVARLPSTGGHQKEADQKGAFATLVGTPFGGWLLATVAVGLLAFAAWRAWAAVRGTDEKPARRLGWAASAVAYANLFALAIGVLRDRGSDGGSDKQAMTARVLSWPGGPVIVGIAGLVIVGIALNYLRKGVEERFLHDIDEGAVPDRLHLVVRVVGVAGWLGRSLVWALAGWFILQAAWSHDANEPVGLDQSLRTIAGESWGTSLLWVAAAGLASYGLVCLATAAWLDPPD
jgi:hypothetical protein